MNVEILYPEYCNLYGEIGNVKFLEKCLPNANFIYTSLNDTPYFVNNEVDFIYIGATTENSQEEIIELLLPFKKRIIELIDSNIVILATGNSLEIFGKHIDRPNGSRIKALEIFDIYAVREDNDRFNELSLGVLRNTSIEVVGFKNQLSFSFGNNSEYFLEMIKGTGINKDSKIEGINKNNFFGTYLLGPILALNPKFVRVLLEKLNVEEITIPFEAEALEAYELRLKEFKERA